MVEAAPTPLLSLSKIRHLISLQLQQSHQTLASQQVPRLVVLGIAEDSDGTLPTLTYSWDNLSTGATIGSASSVTLSTTITSPTDVIACTITATDADGETETSTASVSLENSAPVINSVSITPDPANSSEQVSCQVSWDDADDEVLTPTYLWVNTDTGTTLGTSTSLSLDPSLIQPSETLSCTVSLSDNYGASVSDSDCGRY